jgi:DNA primase
VGRYARSILDGLIDRDLLREKAELTSRLARTDPQNAELRRSLQVALASIDRERMRLRGE